MSDLSFKTSLLLAASFLLTSCMEPSKRLDLVSQPQIEGLPIKVVAITPVTGARSSDEVYQRSVVLIKALRNAGFEVGTVRNSSDSVQGTGPYLFVGADVGDPKYCLESFVRGKRLPEGKNLQFEYRLDRYDRALALSDTECADKWAAGLRSRVIDQFSK